MIKTKRLRKGESQSKQRKIIALPEGKKKKEGAEPYHQLSRKESRSHREGLDKGEEKEIPALRNNVARCLLQLCLQGRPERLQGEMSPGEKKKKASTAQVRRGCSDLWILLSRFSESLCYKGK